MDPESELLKELSRYNVGRVASWVGNDTERFGELFRLFQKSTHPLIQRVAWAMSICLDDFYWLGKPYHRQMVAMLSNPAHPAVTRTILRYFAETDPEEELQGEIYDFCYHQLTNTFIPAAIRVHSMQVMYNIGAQNPELLSELGLILREILPLSNGGVLNRGTKLLKKIDK